MYITLYYRRAPLLTQIGPTSRRLIKTEPRQASLHNVCLNFVLKLVSIMLIHNTMLYSIEQQKKESC